MTLACLTAPGANLDFASFSFHVPIHASGPAKQSAVTATERNTVARTVLGFMGTTDSTGEGRNWKGEKRQTILPPTCYALGYRGPGPGGGRGVLRTWRCVASDWFWLNWPRCCCCRIALLIRLTLGRARKPTIR